MLRLFNLAVITFMIKRIVSNSDHLLLRFSKCQLLHSQMRSSCSNPFRQRIHYFNIIKLKKKLKKKQTNTTPRPPIHRLEVRQSNCIFAYGIAQGYFRCKRFVFGRKSFNRTIDEWLTWDNTFLLVMSYL